MTIQLTNDQISKMRIKYKLDAPKPEDRNYHGMYQHIYDKFGHLMSKEQKYWFKQAAQINEYLNALATPEDKRTEAQKVVVENPSQSAYFIQQINIESLTIAKQTNPKVPDRHNQSRQ